MAVMINDHWRAEAWKLIEAERARALSRHPNLPKDHLRRTAIMAEEAGEALREALDLTREWALNTTGLSEETVARIHQSTDEILDNLLKETVECGSAAINNIAAMLRERQERREKILS